MNTLVIDDMAPKSIIASIGYSAQNLQMGYPARSAFVGTFTGFGGGLGFDPKKLLDWRTLERRRFELRTEQKALSDAFWDLARSYHRTACEQGLRVVWFVDPTDSASGLQYDDDGLGMLDVTREIRTHIARTQDLQRRALIITGEQATEVFRMSARKDSYARRVATYTRAFQHAVASRVDTFVNERLDRSTRRWRTFSPAIIVVTNEGREYLVQVDSTGTLKWLEDELFMARL